MFKIFKLVDFPMSKIAQLLEDAQISVVIYRVIIIIIIMYANLYSAITLQKNYKGALHKNCHRL